MTTEATNIHSLLCISWSQNKKFPESSIFCTLKMKMLTESITTRLIFDMFDFTIHMWLSSIEVGQEPSSSCSWIWYHLYHHGVGCRNESSRPERSTEMPELLYHVRVSVIHIHIVVATERISLQVKNPEGQRDYIALWNLVERDRVLKGFYSGIRYPECGVWTHCDVPGTFAVGFVERWESFTAHKAWVSNQITATVKHRPGRARKSEREGFLVAMRKYWMFLYCTINTAFERWVKLLTNTSFAGDIISQSTNRCTQMDPQQLKNWIMRIFSIQKLLKIPVLQYCNYSVHK